MATEFKWWVGVDHPAFAGHFPDRAILPGVLLLDRAILFVNAMHGNTAGIWQVRMAKFLAPVEPGTELLFVFVLDQNGAISFTIRSVERVVATGSLTPAL